MERGRCRTFGWRRTLLQAGVLLTLAACIRLWVRPGLHRNENPEALHSHWNMKTIQGMRKERIHHVCEWAVGEAHRRKTFQTILVDDQNNLLYCVVPKVACTNIKRMLVQLVTRRKGRNQKKNSSEDAVNTATIDVHNNTQLKMVGLRYLDRYSEKETKFRLKSYYKFMFVREPFERLLSAFRDKFEKTNKWTRYFHQVYGREIIKTFRRNPSRDSLSKGDDVMFSEFVKYVIEQDRLGVHANHHWTPATDLCGPCTVQYDFIGHYETLSVDSSVLIDMVVNTGGKYNISFPSSTQKGKSTSKLMESYYKTIPRSDIEALQKVFRYDFLMYKYDRNSIFKPFALQ